MCVVSYRIAFLNFILGDKKKLLLKTSKVKKKRKAESLKVFLTT